VSNKNIDVLIGGRIRDARKKKGISQQELANKTGIQNSSISAFENGKKSPGLHSLALIAKALNVSMDDLYFGDSSVDFIENAPDKGRKIANCIYELMKENVISCSEIYNRREETDSVLLFRFSSEVKRLIDSLRVFFSKKNTYPNPDEYIKQLIGSVANEINEQIVSIE